MMDKAQTSKGRLRFRLYYRLMDVCLAFAVLTAVDWILSPYNSPKDAPVWYIILGVVALTFTFAVPFFLIVARFMRDDYAETLWRRSLVVMAYGAAIVPVVILVAAWAVYYIVLLGTDPTAPLDASQSVTAPHYIDGFFFDEEPKVRTMIALWQTFVLSFVTIFQFLRWRDSR